MWIFWFPQARALPVKGKRRELSRFSQFKREVQRRTALEWGLDFPYVPLGVVDIVEVSCTNWEEEPVWDLNVPKPQRGLHNKGAWARFQDIRRELSLERAIYRD